MLLFIFITLCHGLLVKLQSNDCDILQNEQYAININFSNKMKSDTEPNCILFD